MVYCAQARLIFSTAARRDAVYADIESDITGKNRWGVTTLSQDPRNGLYLEARFMTRADEQSLQARIEAFATGQRTPQAGSYLRLHDCTHDEGTNICTPTYERVW